MSDAVVAIAHLQSGDTDLQIAAVRCFTNLFQAIVGLQQRD